MGSDTLLATIRIPKANNENAVVCFTVKGSNTTKGEKGESYPHNK